jgi:hypothetical protein
MPVIPAQRSLRQEDPEFKDTFLNPSPQKKVCLMLCKSYCKGSNDRGDSILDERHFRRRHVKDCGKQWASQKKITSFSPK